MDERLAGNGLEIPSASAARGSSGDLGISTENEMSPKQEVPLPAQANNDAHGPLVSVVVITYNSARFVLETLESIKNQTYQNIELIIADDCSSDETLKICRDWISQNKGRFFNADTVALTKNLGVAHNCNAGLNASRGEWVKVIAGDDLIFPDGIETYVRFVLENPKINVVVSDLQFFGERNGRFTANPAINHMTLAEQLKNFLLNNKSTPPSIGPSGFYRRQAIAAIGGYDTRYPMIEDYPLTLKLIDSGIKIYVLNHVCVGYRINSGSISTDAKFSKRFTEMYKTCAYPVLRARKMYFVMYHFYISRIIQNRSFFVSNCAVTRYFLMATSPYAWREYLKRIRVL